MKKKIFYFLIIVSLILIIGCSKKEINITKELDEKDEIQTELELEKELELDVLNETLEFTKVEEKINYSLVTGDNISMALEFADDLIMERFNKLEQVYSYGDKMQEEIGTIDTKKTVIYQNKTAGYVDNVNKPYIFSYGAFQYVYVPVSCSIKNYNIQIVFDGHQRILGFSYVAYQEKNSRNTETVNDNVVETKYFFESNGYILSGTLTTPRLGKNFPVVILVQGAGPSDQDESIYMNKPFKDIAIGLAEQGVASFRYNKRSYLYYEELQSDTTFTIKDDIVEDAVAAAKWITNISTINSEKVFILGHSTGGYVTPQIAQELDHTAGYILLAAPATHIRNQILSIYEAITMENGSVSKKEQDTLNKIKNQVSILATPEEIPENKKFFGYYKNYWMDLLEYNPIDTGKNIREPVLVLQGGRDYQVSMTQFNIWKGNFDKYKNWKFKSYDTLNHFMMEGTGIFYTYEYQTASKVSSQVIHDIVMFVLQEKEK